MPRRPRIRRARRAAAPAAACAALALAAAAVAWNHDGTPAQAEPAAASVPAEDGPTAAQQEEAEQVMEFTAGTEQPEEGLTPREEDFYLPPDPLPAGEPGDVIRAEPVEAFLDPLRADRFPADVWRVMYLSTDSLGEPMAVTGTVMVPTAPWEGEGERPLVAHAIGTHGLGDQCAPSVGLTRGLEFEAPLMKRIIDDGYAMVVPDYEGFGTPGVHTFMAGRSQGRAVLDSLRAATRLAGADVPAGSPMGVSGFSQGGGAAVWAAQLHPDYAPELPLAGVAAGGVPADLYRVARSLEGGAYFSFLGFAAIGLDNAYPDLSLGEHLDGDGAALMADLEDDCLVEALPKGMFMSLDDVTVSDPLDTPRWRERLAENLPGETVPTVPLYMYHSALDDAIPIGQAAELRDRYCAAGADLQWHRTYSGGHATSMYLDHQGAHDWMGDRLAGRPTHSTC